MSMGIVECKYCSKKFLKDNRHIHENIKLRHSFYCSLKCQSLFKNQQKEFTCENKDCKNKFKRALHTISAHNFCSSLCAAIFNNTKRWGVKKPRKLLNKAEKRRIFEDAKRKYWDDYWLKHSHEYVISRIQDFVTTHGRIPVKRELYGIYKPARKFFGTWNKAIKAAGYNPNPVLFANKQIAKDGHICDAMAERIIDDYLFRRKIVHERNCPYPEGSYTADFKIGNQLIEYFGLSGEHKRYDKLKKIKQNLAIKYKLQVIEIYPKNLYSKNGLEKLLKI